MLQQTMYYIFIFQAQVLGEVYSRTGTIWTDFNCVWALAILALFRLANKSLVGVWLNCFSSVKIIFYFSWHIIAAWCFQCQGLVNCFRSITQTDPETVQRFVNLVEGCRIRLFCVGNDVKPNQLIDKV